MNGRRLALMPKDAFLVNVGRGSAIDEAALLAQMRSGHLSGAALDVFATEPLPSDSPLWDCPRLLITTHVAGNMTLAYTVDRIVGMFLENFGNYCAGNPLSHLVDPRPENRLRVAASSLGYRLAAEDHRYLARNSSRVWPEACIRVAASTPT